MTRYGDILVKESEAQQMMYDYLKQFGYTKATAFELAKDRSNGGTLLYKLFKPTDAELISHVYYVEDESYRIPLAIRTVAIKGEKVLLYMGLMSLKDKMKHGVVDDKTTTAGGITSKGKLLGKSFLEGLEELFNKVNSPAPRFTTNPSNRNQVIPIGYDLSTPEDMTPDLFSTWMQRNYPTEFGDTEFRDAFQRMLDQLQWTPEKDSAYKKVVEYSKGRDFSKFMYDTEPSEFNRYYHIGNLSLIHI